MKRRTVLLVVLLSVLILPRLHAQNSTIQGVLSDQSGAVVPDVEVMVSNLETGVTARMKTNERGFYAFPFLPPGNYKVEASKEGFAPQVREKLKLDVGQIARVDFAMTVGTVLATVAVSAAAALLESESTQMGQVIDNKRIVEMPLNKRNYLELARLSPGVLPAMTMGTGARVGRSEAGFVAMGQRGNQTTVLVDGIDNNSAAGGGEIGWQAQAVKPSVDAVAEFKVLTNNFSAEYGFRSGPKVIVSLKSGSNNYHGALFEFLRNEKLDGTNFFANRSGSRKPSYRQNQFGGVLGGPVVRDRTFFFFSFEGTRIRLGKSLSATVPSMPARGGDFSGERANLARVYDPLTTTGADAAATRLPFPGAVVPRSRFDPVVANIISLYPQPNVAGREFAANNFFSVPSDKDDTNQMDGRFDHNFSLNDRVFFRYSHRTNDRIGNGPLSKEAGGGSNAAQIVGLAAHNLAANWTHSFSPALHNELRFGYTHLPTVVDNLLQEPLNQKYGIKNAPGDTFEDGIRGGFSAFTPAGFTGLGVACCWPNINNFYNRHVAENLMTQRGAHSLRAGGEWRMSNQFRNAARLRRGQFNFSGVYTAQQPNVAASRTNTGNAVADMLLGQAVTTSLGNNNGEDSVARYWGFYFQDDWKVSPSLTLNLGLRWEYYASATFRGGSKSGFGGVSNYITALSGVPANDPRIETFIKPKDDNDSGAQQDLNNWSPRIGLAWRLSPRTVVRTAGGIFYGQADAINIDGSSWVPNTPDFTEVTTNGTNTQPAAFAKDGFPFVRLPATAPVPGSGVIAMPLKRVNFYASQWFLDVQRELPGDLLFTIGYQGTKSTKLSVARNINNPGPHPTVPARLRLLRPQWSSVEFRGEPMGNASYQALVSRVEKRFSRGLTFLLSYTWSHNIDNHTEFNDLGTSLANPYDLRNERANSNLDHRQSFTTSATYELPVGRGRAYGANLNPVVDGVLGGWQVGGVLVFRSGFPFDISYPGDPQNTGTTNRGDRVASGRLDSPTIDRWFDEMAFVQSTPGVFGNNGRNVLVGPGMRGLDFMMGKRFTLPWEGHSMQFRFEAFNFTNTPRFGQPSGGLRAPATATINSADEPRRIQLGLKYIF